MNAREFLAALFYEEGQPSKAKQVELGEALDAGGASRWKEARCARWTKLGQGVLPFAQECVLFSFVGFQGNLSLLINI